MRILIFILFTIIVLAGITNLLNKSSAENSIKVSTIMGDSPSPGP